MPKPGQFYMLQVGKTYDPLLKRPFCIFKREGNVIQFVYRIRGKGTRLLSNCKKGDIIQAIGPLGNSYPAPKKDFIAVAGGIGIASLFPLLERFKNKAFLFYGARTKNELVMINKAKSLAKKIFTTTDDGSIGQKGLITDVLNDFLENRTMPVYAGGPMPMLQKVSDIVAGRGIECYASLEEHMACGVGACLGCVVKTVSGYKRVCKEGPVFPIEEIVW